MLFSYLCLPRFDTGSCCSFSSKRIQSFEYNDSRNTRFCSAYWYVVHIIILTQFSDYGKLNSKLVGAFVCPLSACDSGFDRTRCRMYHLLYSWAAMVFVNSAQGLATALECTKATPSSTQKIKHYWFQLPSSWAYWEIKIRTWCSMGYRSRLFGLPYRCDLQRGDIWRSPISLVN